MLYKDLHYDHIGKYDTHIRGQHKLFLFFLFSLFVGEMRKIHFVSDAFCNMLTRESANVTQMCPTLCNPMDLSMEFSRPGCWSGSPFPSPGDLPNPGIEPRSPALQVNSLPAEPPGNSPLINLLSLLS